MISGMPIINLLCRVLWRISSIVTYVATEPPSAHSAKMADSLVRCRGECFDAHLSYMQTTIETSDIAAKYRRIT